MKLNAIQKSILAVQLVGIAFNLYAIFFKKVTDWSGHVFSICILLTIMILSILCWKKTSPN